MDENNQSNAFKDFGDEKTAAAALENEEADVGYPACIAAAEAENHSYAEQKAPPAVYETTDGGGTKKTRRWKKPLLISAAVVFSLLLVVGGIGFIVKSQRRAWAQAERTKIAQAQSQMLKHEAEQQNISLIDEAQVKQSVCAALGADESGVEFRSILLSRLPQSAFDQDRGKGFKALDDWDDWDDWDDEHDEHDERDSRDGRNGGGNPDQALPPDACSVATANAGSLPDAAQPPVCVPAPITQASPGTPPVFQAFYQVQCVYDGLNYRFTLDALKGGVLSYDIRS